MSGAANAQTDVVWPGYVAAMASLLLSLLLVAAVLVVTISQIGGLSETYQGKINDSGFKSREEVERIAKRVGLSDASFQEAAQSGSASNTGAGLRVLGAGGSSIEGRALDLVRANFDPGYARQAATRAAQNAEVLAQVNLAHVDVMQIGFAGLDLSKIDLSAAISANDMKKIDFSKVDFGSLPAARIETLKPFIAKEAIRARLQQLQWQQAERRLRLEKSQLLEPRSTPPPAAVLPAATPQPRPELALQAPDKWQGWQVTYVEEASTLSAAQRQQLLQALAGLQAREGKLRISVNLPSDDLYLQRTAYARLMSLRALAVEAGIAPTRIRIDMVTQPDMAFSLSEMNCYLSWVKS